MKEEYYMEGSYAAQPYKFQGNDKGTYETNRQYFSYGNRFKDLSVMLGYNRLDSESQPMTYLIDDTGLQAPGTKPAVSGAVPAMNSRGKPSIIYGDTGTELVHTDLAKLKLGYDITPDLQTIFTGGYEERTRFADNPRNYLTTASGGTIYGNNSNSNRDASAFGQSFNVQNTKFGLNKDDRQTMQLGLQLKGAISKTWDIDTTVSYLDVLKDEKTVALFNPNDPLSPNPAAGPAGASAYGFVQAFDEYNWKNYDLKLSTKELFGLKQVDFLGGYHWDNYNLGFQQFDLADYANSTRGTEQTSKRNTGETSTHAVFGQTAYHFLPDWDLTLGARYEWWRGENGLVGSSKVPNRNDEAISPKASLGFEPGDWKFRYSMGRAYRFPIIAELYQSLNTPTAVTTASSSLSPEDGWYHNFMIEYGLTDGYIRTSVFKENIRNAIQAISRASGPITSTATQNIPETSATGVEFIFDKQKIFDSNFDFNFNTTWTKAIVEDGGSDVTYTAADGTRSTFSLTGKKLILVPEWRLNAITTYHITHAWDASLAGRYNSKMYGDVDNKDNITNVYGAQDAFFFMDFKTSYRFKPKLFDKQANTRVSFGINNLTDETAFVFHPYPQRTFFVEGAISF